MFSFSVLFVLFLAACGNSKGEDTDASDKDLDSLSYSLTEEITSEDGFLHNFQVDDSGEVILFGKGQQGDEHPMVYADGEVTELNTDYYGMHSYMTSNGVVLGDSTEDHETYTYHFYDGHSGEESEYTVDQDFITMTYRTDYKEDENGMFEEVLRSVDPSNYFDLDFVNLANDTFETVEFTEYLEGYTDSGRFDRPHAFYSPDGDAVYLLVREEDSDGDYTTSFHKYDIEKDEIDVIAEMPEYYSLANVSDPFTSDGDHVLLTSDFFELHILQLENGEMELVEDEAKYVHNLDGNKYASMDTDAGEVIITSLDDGETEVVHTVDNMEDRRISDFIISRNGNTLAYIYEDTSGDEKTYHLDILNID